MSIARTPCARQCHCIAQIIFRSIVEYMKDRILRVEILTTPQFYTLYADGHEDTMIETPRGVELLYPPQAVLFLYYTFPAHRRVYCVRNTEGGMSSLPGLSLPVSILFKQFASRVDKTKRAASYLREHYPSFAYALPDSFYTRLGIHLLAKGKLSYTALDSLVQRSLSHGCLTHT